MKNFNHKLFNRGDTLIVAVSGGADSVALLHLLIAYRHRLGVKLHVAHFDHAIRKDSNGDAAFVAKIAKEQGLPFYLGRRRGKGKLSEEKARDLRVGYLCGLAEKLKAQAIVTGHHRNDLAETVLMRIVRGTGLLGLRGILSIGQWGKVKVVRPLLNSSRHEIEKYLKQHRLNYREDSTNQSTDFLRNKIRLSLLPLLMKEYNHQVIDALANLADVASVDYDYLVTLASDEFDKCAKVKNSIIELNRKRLVNLHPALIRLVIRLSLTKLTNHLKVFNHAHYCLVADFLTNEGQKNMLLPDGVKVTKTANVLKLSI